jgi:hypothetical protein
MSESNLQVCPACGVKITATDQVLFSSGTPGSRGRLWARVCQYAKKSGCINQDEQAIGRIPAQDFYDPTP